MKPFLPRRTRHSFVLSLLLVLITIIPAVSFSQANNNCIGAIALTPSTTCTNTSGSLTGATTYQAITNLPGCGTANRNDVWYTFVARTPNPTITLSNVTFANPQLTLLTGNCGGFGATSTCGTTSIAATGLTVGTTYYIRVYSSTNATGTFDICVQDPIPANDDCTGAILLTANATCVNTSGNMYGATASSPAANAAAVPCTGPVLYDVWYYFLAPTSSVTITLSSPGVSIGTPRLQLFSGDCGGPVSIACGTTSIAITTLIPNNYYYFRVYGSSGSLPTTQTNAGFNVCVSFLPVVPANDNCAGAVTLPVRTTCVKTLATLSNATASGVATACGGSTTSLDVWFKFVATNANQTINVGDYAANYPGNANRRLQLFSGTCLSLSAPLYCVSGSTINATGLTVGTTYFIRVFVTNTTVITSLADFTICVYTTPSLVRYGNSYANITKKTTGGIVEPNDILEIRMTVNVSSSSDTLRKIRYLDSVPTHTTMLTGATDKISVITNEGIVVQNYTTNTGDDAASYVANPGAGNYQVRMNLGFGTTTTPVSGPGTPANNTPTENASATGIIAPPTHIPKGGAGVLFATSFRVRVSGVVGDTIKLAAGKIIYQANAAPGTDIVLTGTPYYILISSPMSLCPNSTGINMSDEFGGTFGSGTTLNRGTDLNSPITSYDFVNISAYQALFDGQYSIVKNMSPRSGTNRNAERSPTNTTSLPNQNASAYRMHGGHWDIDGDHTGTNNGIGNPPLSDSITGGYMLMVNADYIASETYRQTLNNLCPSTYYEFSAWVRNICPTCGINYVNNSNWSPRQSGVRPNLTFSLDGLDRYSTGEIDSASGWIKKGFVFLTDTNQTSASFSIRNNSQGGGGNDWVMDDITVATCLPTMLYSPNSNPTICSGTYITLSDTVTSFFNNYINYKWQRSTNGGGTWTDLTGNQVGVNAPYGSQFRYTTNYTVPPANTGLGNTGDLYRVIVATRTNNLGNPTCQVSDGISLITLNIINCGAPLKTDLLTFNGKLTDDDKASLSWTTSKEEGPLKYYVERSMDGNNFTSIGYLNGYNNGSTTNQYVFIDPVVVTGKVYYRVSIVNPEDNKKYTNTIQLSKQKAINFAIANVVNPFNQKIDLTITAPKPMRVDVELVDLFGKIVSRKSFLAQTGTNLFSLTDTEPLPAGTYVLRVSTNDHQVITRKVLKKNNL